MDDEPRVLELRMRLLELQGYVTVGAESGHRALTLFESICPNLVALDYKMPEMNGHEVALQMRRTILRSP